MKFDYICFKDGRFIPDKYEYYIINQFHVRYTGVKYHHDGGSQYSRSYIIMIRELGLGVITIDTGKS